MRVKLNRKFCFSFLKAFEKAKNCGRYATFIEYYDGIFKNCPLDCLFMH